MVLYIVYCLNIVVISYEKLNEFCQELIHILKSHTKNPRYDFKMAINDTPPLSLSLSYLE